MEEQPESPWDELKAGAKRDQPRMNSQTSFPLAEGHNTGDTEKKMFLCIKSRPRTPPWVRPMGFERAGSAFDAIRSQTSHFPTLAGPYSPGASWSGGKAPAVRQWRCTHCTAGPGPLQGAWGHLHTLKGLMSRDGGRGSFGQSSTEIYSTSSKGRQEPTSGSRGNERGFKEQVSGRPQAWPPQRGWP